MWSPYSWVPRTSQPKNTIDPSKTGTLSSVSVNRYSTPPVRSSNFLAKYIPNSCCFWANIFTPNRFVYCKNPWVWVLSPIHTIMVGGSRHIDEKAFAVIEWGCPSSSRVVITVTPVANWERADLNSFWSNKAIPTQWVDPVEFTILYTLGYRGATKILSQIPITHG